jgi:hypothetical protein
MFFQDTPPDTSAYMIAGYTVFTVVMAIYLLSLFVRSRNLQRDLTALESLKQESKPASTESIGAGSKAAKSNESKAAASKRKTGAKKKTRK